VAYKFSTVGSCGNGAGACIIAATIRDGAMCACGALMIIDCHGHYTTVPKTLHAWRERPLAAIERGSDLTIFSPIAGQMAHHLGNEHTSLVWAEVCNDLIYRVCQLYPDNFAPVCQLPQSPGAPPKNCIAELRRCVLELGFGGCNLSPDPSGGHWKEPPLTDRWWYPLYEEMVALDVPAMVHVSSSCNPCFHGTGAHYINGDTTAFMQFLVSDLFKDFPTLRFVIPHGGGAVPYHWGRYRGLSLDLRQRPMEELLKNVWFDTCVYHGPGVDFLTRIVPIENILFGSEMIGAVRGKDPLTGEFFDDT
jgi:4-oxalmesaconate hydratase